MKKLLLLLIISTPIYAQDYSIDTISVDEDFDINFTLSNSTHSKYSGALTCQNFIKKLDFFDTQGGLLHENYITMEECQEIYDNTLRCFKKSKDKCFDMNNILSILCECE